MKKEYKKPELLFDSFELSTNIASGCATKVYHSETSCSYSDGVGKIFLDMTICDYAPGDSTTPNICYHNPTPETALFDS